MPRKYPWDEWLDGKWWTLGQGVHFDCSIESFVNGAMAAAKRRGKGVTIQRRVGIDSVRLRAQPGYINEYRRRVLAEMPFDLAERYQPEPKSRVDWL